MNIYPVIDIPEELWLNVNNFNFESFTYEDYQDIYNSPNSLIDDFQKNNDFNIRLKYLNEKNRMKETCKMNNHELLSQRDNSFGNSYRQIRPDTPIFNNLDYSEKPKVNKIKILYNIFMKH